MKLTERFNATTNEEKSENESSIKKIESHFKNSLLSVQDSGSLIWITLKKKEMMDNLYSVSKLAHIGKIGSVGLDKKGNVVFSIEGN